MRRFVWCSLVVVAALTTLAGAASAARVVRVERRGHVRTRVVVREGFPIRRTLPVVVVHRPQRVVVTERIVYARPVIWAPVVVPLPPRERLVWEDGETLVRDEGWADVQLDVNDRGEKLYLELTGRTRLDFAEVVFGNGEAQVVDFNERAYRPGIYSLLDFPDGRHVRFVHLVARAMSPESRVIVRMEK